MSASGQEEIEHKDYEILEWMHADDSTERAGIHMRRNIIRDLSSEPRDSVLMTTRMLIKPECLHECHPSYAKALHALLISKGVQILNPLESRTTIWNELSLGKILISDDIRNSAIPTRFAENELWEQSDFATQSAHSDSAQPTGPPRSGSGPRGPATDGSTGLQP